ncbi:MAG: M20/M25/M40 family metallo-hydrolase [Oscillospiraceae bacterium]|nr:M20/M25/M40 family metallo-hydrolase [Oscillospiraceae bacterium]
MDLTETIFELSRMGGASGQEGSVAGFLAEKLREYMDNVRIKNGSVIAEMGTLDENAPKIVLDAHTDRIGFIVTSVCGDGFLKVHNLGGIDMRILSAQRVIIHGKKDVKGVICSIPPHLRSKKEVPDISQIYIDTGLSEAQAKDIISAGDTVTFDTEPKMLLGTRITGGALDDRSGIAAILYALSITDISTLKCRLAVVFSAQEEVGERGAAVCAFEEAADIAIAVDVSFAYSSGEKPDKCGTLGKGCMIGFAPTLDGELSREFVNIAKSEDIPYQLEVMGGTTGTNADRYSVSGSGARAVTLSIPLKYMHTPAEMIDLNDVIGTGKLIYAYLKGACR